MKTFQSRSTGALKNPQNVWTLNNPNRNYQAEAHFPCNGDAVAHCRCGGSWNCYGLWICFGSLVVHQTSVIEVPGLNPASPTRILM